MGRASTRTLLPLDRWAAILGIEPRHFNGVFTALRPTENCGDVWLQYSWQNADRVGREDVALAIAQAEADVIEALGFLPVPDWTEDEIVRVRGVAQGVNTKYGHVISGGVRAATLIGAAAIVGGTMVWIDNDGDGYDEIARLTLPTTVTDPNEIRCYFPDMGSSDLWEIRPLRNVTITGGIVIIDVDRHLLVVPDLWEALDAAAIDGDNDANFLEAVNVYRIYNDPSDQCELQWESASRACGCGLAICEACQWATQSGCLQIRDPKQGILTYRPASWNDTESVFAATTLALCRQPDRVSLDYLSGYRSLFARRPYAEMDPTFERIITYYSTTLLDRPICNCNNIESFINRWREDRALELTTATTKNSYKLSPHDLACPWGTREGALWAWRQIQRYALGRAVEY